MDPVEYTVEVYTHDNRLLATLILGEGRQRSYPADDYDSPPPDNSHILSAMQGQIMQMEKEKENMEQRMKQERKEMELRMEQERKEIEQRIEQEREEIERQMELEIRRQVKQVRDDMKYQAK